MNDSNAMGVRRFLDAIVAEGRVRGAGIYASAHGRTVVEHYAGEAAPGLAASATVLWPLASISKLYTAATAVAAIERGDLTYNVRICTLLPEFTNEGRDQITLRHLLTHTSGLPYESPEMPARMQALTPFDALLDESYHGPLLFPPGTDHNYSDWGYGMIRRTLETVTGRPFVALVEDYLLDPGGLDETWFTPSNALDERIARSYGAFAEGTAGAMYNSRYSRELAHPAFGVVATLPDLHTFLHFFLPGSDAHLHSAAGLRLMTTDQTWGDEAFRRENPRQPTCLPYGAGFAIKADSWTPDLASPGSYGHGGATGCIAWIDPAHGLVSAFVSNQHYNANPDECLNRLMTATNLVYAALPD